MSQDKLQITLIITLMFALEVTNATDLEVTNATDIATITKENIYNVIAKENLKSITNIEKNNTGENSSSSSSMKEEKYFHDILKEKLHEQLNLDLVEKRNLVFHILSSAKDEVETKNRVLDEKTWQDLEMLCGPKSNPAIYLASKIDRTSTEIGKISLYKKIVTPTSNAKQLIKEQNIVKELVEDEKLFNILDANLKELVISENSVLSFWKEDIFGNINAQQKTFLPFPKKIRTYIEDYTIKNETMLEFFARKYFFASIFDNAIAIIGIGTLSLVGILLILEHIGVINQNIITQKLKDFNSIFGISAAGIFNLEILINKILKSKFLEGEINILSSAVDVPSIPRKLYGPKEFLVFYKCMEEKLIHVSTFTKNLVKMAVNLQKHKKAKYLKPLIQSLNNSIKNFYTKSNNSKLLLRNLATKTFEGEPALFFAHWGRTYVTYMLMRELKNEFKQIILAIGEIDSYMSIAKLYKEFENKSVKFCFPEYDFSTQTPSINIENFWNPFINPEKVTPNSLRLGERYRKPQNIVISGPNAAGKSTIVKGLIISIILAQSIGIAPASKLTFTPFNKIITYLNITDDIASGNSHFKAGVKRARELYDIVENLNENEKSLLAVDELFNGTTYKEGQAAAYSFIKQLGHNTKNICITATHFPDITKLEERTGLFTNYKVSVSETGKITYPYKLEKGISNQIITFKILKEEGFNDNFLKEAEKQLMESKKTSYNFRQETTFTRDLF